MSQSATEKLAWEVNPWWAPLVCTTNYYPPGVSPTDLEWINANVVAVRVNATVWLTGDLRGARGPPGGGEAGTKPLQSARREAEDGDEGARPAGDRPKGGVQELDFFFIFLV